MDHFTLGQARQRIAVDASQRVAEAASCVLIMRKLRRYQIVFENIESRRRGYAAALLVRLDAGAHHELLAHMTMAGHDAAALPPRKPALVLASAAPNSPNVRPASANIAVGTTAST